MVFFFSSSFVHKDTQPNVQPRKLHPLSITHMLTYTHMHTHELPGHGESCECQGPGPPSHPTSYQRRQVSTGSVEIGKTFHCPRFTCCHSDFIYPEEARNRGSRRRNPRSALQWATRCFKKWVVSTACEVDSGRHPDSAQSISVGLIF